nr:hypothetical protein [uncultured Pseudomonas sp.]
MSEANVIQPVEVKRDEYGHWTHPAWPESDDEMIPRSWFTFHGLEIGIVEFENDAPEELTEAYFESGEPDCTKWEPSKPVGDGWFVFSIHDTDDGPICVWVRHRT